MVAVQRRARHHENLGVEKQKKQVTQRHAVGVDHAPELRGKARHGGKRNGREPHKLHNVEDRVKRAKRYAELFLLF